MRRRPLLPRDTAEGPMNTICLLGLGYIGLPTGSMFALAGKDVIGVDPSPRVQAALKSGVVPIDEPELETLVTAAIKSGHLRVQHPTRSRPTRSSSPCPPRSIRRPTGPT